MATHWQWDNQGDPQAVAPTSFYAAFNITLTGSASAKVTGGNGMGQGYVCSTIEGDRGGQQPYIDVSASMPWGNEANADSAVPARTLTINSDNLYPAQPSMPIEVEVGIILRGSMVAEARPLSTGYVTGSATTVVGMKLTGR